MSEQNSKAPDDRLEQAIAALRDAVKAEGVPPQLEAATIEILNTQARAQAVRALDRRKLMFRIARFSGVAAAIGLVAVLAGWLFLVDHPAALAFGDVVENIKNAKSVTFITKMPTIIQGTKKGILLQKFYVQGDAYRMEIPTDQEGIQAPAGAPPIAMIGISDAKQRKAILLDMAAKTAMRIDADDKIWQKMAKAFADPIKQLRQLKDQDAERIGTEDWEGRKAEVYRLKKTDIFLGMTVAPPEVAKLWVDPKTRLPVRIAIEQPGEGGKVETRLSFEQFRWNEVFAPDLFKLDVPEGFQLKQWKTRPE